MMADGATAHPLAPPFPQHRDPAQRRVVMTIRRSPPLRNDDHRIMIMTAMTVIMHARPLLEILLVCLLLLYLPSHRISLDSIRRLGSRDFVRFLLVD